MAAAWLYKVDSNGVHVTPEFMAKLRGGDAAALRSLHKQKLTALYQRGFTKESRRDDAEGFFWSSTPPLELVPLVRAGRHPLPPWTKDGPALSDEGCSDRRLNRLARTVRTLRKGLPPDQTISAKFTKDAVEAWYMKANPKFELVVINKHDRGTLLKLLGELDRADSVEGWLNARTERGSASLSKVLFADYAAWCEQTGQTAVGIKTFAQGLVAVGVEKLGRSNSGERYALTLRP